MKLTIDLPVLNGQPARAVPKSERDPLARKRASDRRGKAFRDDVWRIAKAASPDGEAYCACGIGPLKRTLDVLDPLAGHVAHRRGRRVAPEDRYNPDQADLLCRDCHLGGDHGMRFAR